MKSSTLRAEDAAHLLRRIGFEASPPERARWIGLDREAAVEDALAIASAADAPQDEHARLLAGARFLEDQPSIERLQAWWLARLRVAAPPFLERLTLFWHGHFATSDAKVSDARKMLHQHLRFLELGAGRFPLLLEAMVEDPALLIWLDAAENTKDSPNENLARELFELFALGRGAYSETDIREGARALSGLRVRREQAEMRWRDHDNGAKKILGQEAPFTPRALARLATSEPACAEFLARKLLVHFVEPDPSTERVSQAAQHLRESELNVREFLRREFLSERFWSAELRRGLWKSPIQFVVGAVRQLDLQSMKPLQLAEHASAMGQALFLPPNVGGWPEGPAWVSPAAMAARTRFALAAADELSAREEGPAGVERMLELLDLSALDAQARELCQRALDRGMSRDVWVALLAHPLYQRA